MASNHDRSPDARTAERFVARELLAHPVMLVAIAALLLNDHWLKSAHPGWITGKLSDVAGLCFFPVLLAALWQVAAGYTSRPGRLLGATALIAATAFTLIKLSPACGDIYATAVGAVQWAFIAAWKLAAGQTIPPPHRVAVTPDATDLLALPASCTGYLIERHGRSARDRGRS